MKLEPSNRHLLIEPIEEKEQDLEISIVLPTDYKKQESPYLLCKVLSVADDSKFFDTLKQNDKILIERRMLHKIEIKDSEFYLILENYIFGRII